MRLAHRLVGFAITAILAAPLAAADFVVTRYDDPAPNGCAVGDCSLREAVLASNFEVDFDRILLSAGRYELTIPGADDDSAVGDLDVTRDVEIVGPGATMTVVDANLIEGVFHLRSIADVTLRGITILGGISVNGRAFGVHVVSDSATIEDCEIRGDEPGTTGNAVHVSGTTVLTIRRSAVVAAPGTGVNVASGATATLENVTVTGSGSNEIFGISSSTIHISNSTIAAAPDLNPDLTLQATSTANIENSIVAGSCDTSTSTIVSLGGNVQESTSATCGFTQTLDVTVANAMLGVLGSNGGPTRTIAPLAGSVAIGNANDATCLGNDARGVSRPFGAHCDKGAVEVTDTNPPTPLFFDGFQQGDREAWSFSVP